MPGVAVLSQTLEEIAVFEYEGSQFSGRPGSRRDVYARVNNIDSTLREGEYRLRTEDRGECRPRRRHAQQTECQRK